MNNKPMNERAFKTQVIQEPEPMIAASSQTVIEQFYETVIYDNGRIIDLNDRLIRLINRFEGYHSDKICCDEKESQQKEPSGLNGQISSILNKIDTNLSYMSNYITSLEQII